MDKFFWFLKHYNQCRNELSLTNMELWRKILNFVTKTRIKINVHSFSVAKRGDIIHE